MEADEAAAPAEASIVPLTPTATPGATTAAMNTAITALIAATRITPPPLARGTGNLAAIEGITARIVGTVLMIVTTIITTMIVIAETKAFNTTAENTLATPLMVSPATTDSDPHLAGMYPIRSLSSSPPPPSTSNSFAARPGCGCQASRNQAGIDDGERRKRGGADGRSCGEHKPRRLG